MIIKERVSSLITNSSYISRDLSWLKFNSRVLDQSKDSKKSIFERLKFLAITSSNLDEFFMIRAGSLYNYLDYGKERIDYSGLREKPFRKLLLQEVQFFFQEQNRFYRQELLPRFAENGFNILSIEELSKDEKEEASEYFMKTIFPMLTPMLYDNYRTFPILMNKTLTFGVLTSSSNDGKEEEKMSFVQIPQNLPRFYEFDRDTEIAFVPIEEIIRWKIQKLYRNIDIISATLFRITRNGDISVEESDDTEDDFIEEVKRKLKTRKDGRVVRVEVEQNHSDFLLKDLKKRWQIDEDNVFVVDKLMDFTGLFQIAGHHEFKERNDNPPSPIMLAALDDDEMDIFEYLKRHDVLIHQPYNSFEPLLKLMERASEDPDVLAIKITIYRLAKNSRITAALQKAAENGKHVSVLFELKARFDEENNIKEAERLKRAGCFVIHGISRYKTHTKLMLIVRKEEKGVARYVHLSSGNYNEATARIYTDLGLLTSNETYGQDVSEFFNVITGHSQPFEYKNLITSPRDMRNSLIGFIRNEADHAKQGMKSGIIIKINSLEDQKVIDELYAASQAGVKIHLIVRGICCIRPQRAGLSDNITVRSIVGEFLEHSRIYYFQNTNEPIIYVGSADMMVRSFDRRLESLFKLTDDSLRKQVTTLLYYNLKDNVNTYTMQEDGNYVKIPLAKGEKPFNIHREFFRLYSKKRRFKMMEFFEEAAKKELQEANTEVMEMPVQA
jgi:polyphosphate kinase